jgi:hypothetical protein
MPESDRLAKREVNLRSMGFRMQITDPGKQYQYLSIEVDGKRFDVFKECRIRIFDAFWISEPIPEEDKPNTIMSASDVPMELWKILTEEERTLKPSCRVATESGASRKAKVELANRYDTARDNVHSAHCRFNRTSLLLADRKAGRRPQRRRRHRGAMRYAYCALRIALTSMQPLSPHLC